MKHLLIFVKGFVNISVIFFIYKFLTTDFFGKHKYTNKHKHCAQKISSNVNPFLDSDLIEHSHEQDSEKKMYMHSHKYDPINNNKRMKLDNTQLLDEDNQTNLYEEKYELQLEFIMKTFIIMIIILSLCCFNFL
jgi:hypothetical protein